MGFKAPARIALAASVGYGIVYLHNLTYPCRNMDFTWQATPGHSKSFSSRILNPRDGPVDEESYSLRIPTRELPAGITDEELLARFTKGAFGGWIFTPERWIAPLIQRCIDAELISAIKTSSSDPSTPPIWKLDSLSRDILPPLGSTLFGLLTLFDTSTCTEDHRISVFPDSIHIPRPNFAFAEYAGRTKSQGLAASHRFEVTREYKDGEDRVRLTFSHIRSNPRTGGKSLPSWFVWFHVLYSGLLFADGIKEIMYT
ncbi:uncharacterized protein BO80DRAFT_401730 [Aspergillus ibericus CBS 121593]|uniref:Uncharacterized protein n=1 Tax=Aspergillus ibericus CBS 121593 TaxID=1448316 RepID=A0A395H6M5_9EURO|nr:hypothetical protein BO80DRAFT_401730 [Aspergillus ibericus CBS 121593]RAL03581.1 hypothetical protein BO80DRAFT_401730 [Aspergillus ibericus CBS 121593]